MQKSYAKTVVVKCPINIIMVYHQNRCYSYSIKVNNKLPKSSQIDNVTFRRNKNVHFLKNLCRGSMYEFLCQKLKICVDPPRYYILSKSFQKKQCILVKKESCFQNNCYLKNTSQPSEHVSQCKHDIHTKLTYISCKN